MRRTFALSSGTRRNAMWTLADADGQKRVLCYCVRFRHFSRENFTKKGVFTIFAGPAGLGGGARFLGRFWGAALRSF
jgi:hypothetical protein